MTIKKEFNLSFILMIFKIHVFWWFSSTFPYCQEIPWKCPKTLKKTVILIHLIFKNLCLGLTNSKINECTEIWLWPKHQYFCVLSSPLVTVFFNYKNDSLSLTFYFYMVEESFKNFFFIWGNSKAFFSD